MSVELTVSAELTVRGVELTVSVELNVSECRVERESVGLMVSECQLT